MKHVIHHITLSLVLAAISLLAPVAVHAQINAEQVLAIGKNALYFEDYVLSIQYFNQAIKAKPYLAEPYFFRAVAKISLEDYQGAEQDASACIERNPFIIDAYEVRGVARQNMRKFRDAIADYDKGLALNPELKTFIANKALCQVQLHDYDAADSTFRRLQQLDMRNDKAYLGMAQVSLARKDTTQALAYIEKSLALDRKSPMPYAMRADIHMRRPDTYAQAVRDIDSLILLQPHYAGNFINRAFLKYKLDDYFGAMSDFDYAIDLDPENTVAVYDRAQLNAEVGEDAKAIRDFTTVLKREPGNFLALYNRAQLYTRSGQYRRAIADWDKILKKYPRFESGYMTRAQLKMKAGDNAGAQRDNERAIALFKQKGTHVATYNPVAIEAKRANSKMEKQAKEAAARAEAPDTLQTPDNPEEIAKKFNQMLTVKNENSELKPEYANRSRGHVQNSAVAINPEPMFHLTYYDPGNKLNGNTNYMRELTEINDSRLLPQLLQLTDNELQLDSSQIKARFASIDYYNGMLSTSTPRAADYLARAVDHMMVKNPDAALADADRALKLSPKFALAYYLRGDAHYMKWRMAVQGTNPTLMLAPTGDARAQAQLRARENAALLQAVVADMDSVLRLSPKNVYALYNKGNAFLLMGNHTSALACYTSALQLKPDFGQAYYNRGLVYLDLGNREKGIADLSKAGELGILPSYNVIKRINN